VAQVEAFHHVSLSVRDLARSTEWYRRVLGFDIAAEVEGATFRRVRLRSPGGGPTLTLTEHHDAPTQPFDERRAGLDHVAFQLAGLDDLAVLERRFEELGVVRSDVKQASGGAAMVTLRDPDNIQLEVFAGPAPAAVPRPSA
jgi:glyoxylase I family protein